MVDSLKVVANFIKFTDCADYEIIVNIKDISSVFYVLSDDITQMKMLKGPDLNIKGNLTEEIWDLLHAGSTKTLSVDDSIRDKIVV